MKKGKKRALEGGEDEETKGKKVSKWRNRERVLVFCSRGVSHRDRHLMQDLRTLLPHSKAESKMDKNQPLPWINEIAAMRNATKVLYLECRKKKDLYLWVAAPPKGPSAKFLVQNVHTMQELRLAGNCLVGSRPLLSFDAGFEERAELALLRELFLQTLGTPLDHPRSQPFIDHCLHFGLTEDGRIWIRNYQIVNEEGDLEEVGPRMVLQLIKIFDGSFGGEFLYEAPNFLHPNLLRRQAKEAAKGRYVERVQQRKDLHQRQLNNTLISKADPLEDVFQTDPSKLRTETKEEEDDDDKEQGNGAEASRLARAINAKARKRKPKPKQRPQLSAQDS